mgnify:CR=1 FL=1
MAEAVEQHVRALVAGDKSSASLALPARLDPRLVPEPACEAALREAGVEVNADVRAHTARLYERAQRSDQPVSGVVAEAVPPTHGRDGRVEWTVDDQRRDQRAEDRARDDDAAVDYRSLSAYILVKPSQVLGVLHPATPGEDGRDVTGQTLPAKPGREFKLQVNESILIDASGQLIAQDEGVLFREGGKAEIRRLLEIPGSVDFTTGNVDFNGDVIVQRGVRDRFLVKATGTARVMGLIEAAMIDVEQDLEARGGFAGRERGNARVGRHLVAKYLDNVQGQVHGDLKVDREVINCELTVHENVACPSGSIIGGRLCVSGRIEVASLGSGAGVATDLIVGAIPRLEQPLQRLVAMTHRLIKIEDELAEEQRLLAMNRRPSATEKERQCEIMFELDAAQSALTRARAAADALAQRISEKRVVDINVGRRLFPGVRLRLGEVVYRIGDEVRGPLRIELGRGTELRLRRGDSPPKPLGDIADIQTAAHAA